jgi:hypothetical protein
LRSRSMSSATSRRAAAEPAVDEITRSHRTRRARLTPEQGGTLAGSCRVTGRPAHPGRLDPLPLERTTHRQR